MINYHETMAEVNSRLSIFTAYSSWKEQWHEVNLDHPQYADLYLDARHLVRKQVLECSSPYTISLDQVDKMVERVFYVLSTSPEETMSLATLASKLDADCITLFDDYEENINAYSMVVFELRNLGIFQYGETLHGHPVLAPQLQIKGQLQIDFNNKFASAIPQIGNVVGELDSKGDGLLPGIKFHGKSSRRKTPLNQRDREVVSLVSRQRFMVDMTIVNSMQYYVPTITDTGKAISEYEQESARIAYNRFKDMAAEAAKDFVVLQLPTTQDSRGRFYNAAVDPAVRLSLRSPAFEGKPTSFELNLLNKQEYLK